MKMKDEFRETFMQSIPLSTWYRYFRFGFFVVFFVVGKQIKWRVEC